MDNMYKITKDIAKMINDNAIEILDENKGMDPRKALAFAMLEAIAGIPSGNEDEWLEFMIDAVYEVAGDRFSDEKMAVITTTNMLNSMPTNSVAH